MAASRGSLAISVLRILAACRPHIIPMLKHILVLHGPNLNLLGQREPEHYGSDTLAVIDRRLTDRARQAGCRLDAYQSNGEGELVDRIQQAQRDGVDFIIINPAAYTHTSIALRDALAAVRIPFIEVHLSNVFAREKFRHLSYFTDLAVGVISGFGGAGYDLALEYALQPAPGG
jgi:3-dehydroquinate dehydratase-2